MPIRTADTVAVVIHNSEITGDVITAGSGSQIAWMTPAAKRQPAGRRDSSRPIAAKLGAARHLAADCRDLGQRVVEILHRRPGLTLQYKVH